MGLLEEDSAAVNSSVKACAAASRPVYVKDRETSYTSRLISKVAMYIYIYVYMCIYIYVYIYI